MKVDYKDFEKYRKVLYNTAKNYTKFKSPNNDWQYDLDLAKDVVQESYFKFHGMVTNNFVFEDEDHLKQLLLKNIWRTSIDAKKTNKGVKYKSKEDSIDFDLYPEYLHPRNNPEIDSFYKVQRIYQIIHTFRYKKDIDAFLLHIEGYDIKEIQDKTNKTYQSVRESLYRVRKHLKSQINIKNI
jgi:DNA-directed RNA polymerase specialized sigma24 family protein